MWCLRFIKWKNSFVKFGLSTWLIYINYGHIVHVVCTLLPIANYYYQSCINTITQVFLSNCSIKSVIYRKLNRKEWTRYLPKFYLYNLGRSNLRFFIICFALSSFLNILPLTYQHMSIPMAHGSMDAVHRGLNKWYN